MSTGIVHALASEAGEKLVAATFTGGGRTLTTLVPETLLEAETLAQETVGLELTGTTRVGRTQQRAVGFPAWPIITDPGNAQHALNLVADLEWARRHAGTGAKKVKDRFDELITTLQASAPHFVPTLLEELARIYGAAGNEQYAKQYFGQAREVERDHNVPVDPVRHEAAFLEFSRAGIVSAKALTQEAEDAAERFDDPTEAFGYVLRLNVARIQAGQPPYAAMLRDLRKLGKAAGLSDKEADARVFDEVVGLAPLYNAPGGFWTTTATSLAAWLGDHPDSAPVFLERRPASLTIEQWLKLLEDGGAWQRLIDDTPAFTQWLLKTMERELADDNDFSPRFLKAIELAAPQLAGATLAVDFGEVSPDYFDALLEADVTLVAAPNRWGIPNAWIHWNNWAEQKQHPRQLTFLAADERLGQNIQEKFTSTFISEHLDLLLSREGTTTLVSEHLDGLASDVKKNYGSLPFLAHHLDHHLAHLDDPRLKELNPVAVAEMQHYDPAESLAGALRNGVLAELTWPALEQAAEELRAQHPEGKFRVLDSYPQVVLARENSFRVIDGDAVTVSGTLPPNALVIPTALVLGENADEVVFYYHPDSPWTRYVYWNGETARQIEPNHHYLFRNNVEMTLPMDNGRRLSASGLLSPGDVDVEHVRSALISNGEHIFAVTSRGFTQWNPVTESFVAVDKGPGSIPGFCPVEAPEGEIDWATSHLYPAQATTRDSLAGSAEGLHYTLKVDHPDSTSTYVTPLGAFDFRLPVDQVLPRPGGGFWLQVGKQLRDADTGAILSARSGVLDKLPLTAYHHLQPRAPEVSALLREFSPEAAQELLDALVPEPENTVEVPSSATYGLSYQEGQEPEEMPTVNAVPGTPAWNKASELIGSTDPVLVAAVVGMAVDATTLATSHGTEDGEKANEITALSNEAAELLSDIAGLTNFPPNADYWLRRFTQLAQTLAVRTASIDLGPGMNPALIFNIIGHERRLLNLLDSPALDPELVAEVRSFLLSLVDAGVLASGWRAYRAFSDSSTLDAPTWIDDVFVAGYVDDYPRKSYYLVLAQRFPLTVGGIDVTDTEDPQMNAEEFRAALAGLPTERDLPAEAKILAEGTNLTLPEATYILGGLIGRSGYVGAESIKAVRERLALNATDFNRAHDSVNSMPSDLLFAMAMGNGPEEKAEIWRRETGDLGYRLTESENHTVRSSFDSIAAGLGVVDVLTPLGTTDPTNARHLLGPLLTLASIKRSDDPIRPFLAEQLEKLRPVLTGAEFLRIYTRVAPEYLVFAEGDVDELIVDLRRVYDSPPGHPMDPAVCAPEVLAGVEKALELSTDQARFFLQVLALASPTDANIREWNGWKKKDLDAAAAPLVERELLVEAKRSRAGRSRFLPGGWIDAGEGTHGLEEWKEPYYRRSDDRKYYPVFQSSPPLVPMPQLFADAWQRYTDGDIPGYEELNTTRYRRG